MSERTEREEVVRKKDFKEVSKSSSDKLKASSPGVQLPFKYI